MELVDALLHLLLYPLCHGRLFVLERDRYSRHTLSHWTVVINLLTRYSWIMSLKSFVV